MLYKKFAEKMQDALKFANGAPLVLALSGGLDSAVLADLLLRLKGQGACGGICFAHYNHLLRDADAERDEIFCRKLSGKSGVAFFCGCGDVKKYAGDKSCSVEEAARILRYKFLDEVCEKAGSKVLLTAHHADDQAETVLMNIARGSALRGWCGIFPERRFSKNANLFRPLLNITRAELEKYADIKKLKYCTDRTNFETVYARNKVRLQVLPKLEYEFGINRDLLNRFSRVAKRLYRVTGSLCEQVEVEICKHIGNDGVLVNREKMSAYRRFLRSEILQNIARQVYDNGEKCAGGYSPLDAKNVSSLDSFMGESRPGQVLQLQSGLRAECEYGSVRIYMECSEKNYNSKELLINEVPQEVDFSGCTVSIIEREKVNKEEILQTTQDTECIDAAKLTLPLTVRAVRDGDRFTPLGAPGSMLVSDYFTNKKIPQRLRRRALVFEDACGIIWLWPNVIADRVKITSATEKVLQLKIRAYPNINL